MTRRQPAIVISALGLIIGGLWLVLSGLGVPLLTLSRLWPLVLLVAGLALLVENGRRSRKSQGLLLVGSIALLNGLFLLAFSFEVGNLAWANMAECWPVFPLIVGGSFLLVYLTNGVEDAALLVMTYIFGGFGIFLLPFTLGIIGGPVFNQVVRLWPLLLILAALAIVLRLRTRRNRLGAEEK